jgi:KUP system potassium uptake protein
MVTSAHRVEVEVGADGPASAPLSGAVAAAPPAGAEKIKHIDLKLHFLNDHVEYGTVSLRYLPTDRMVANMFTKPLP